MHLKLVFSVFFLALAAAAVWLASNSSVKTETEHGPRNITRDINNYVESDLKPQPTLLHNQAETPSQPNGTKPDPFTKAKTLLELGDYQQAKDFISQHYSALSSAELDALKARFINDHTLSVSLADLKRLKLATEIFDELDSWNALARTAVTLREWQSAFTALMRASELENDSIELEQKLASLVQVTSHLRADLEKRRDELGIKKLYQQAHDLHPGYPRFQLELAYAHMRLGENDHATRLLTGLQYDPDLGNIAQQAMTRIQSANNAETPTSPNLPTPTNDIVVPLLRSGNSFFVNASVNQNSVRLLLDTGASITALSSDLITRMRLKPTGQSIQLSTANGIRQSRLYKAEQLVLGRIKINGLVVAEIDLGPDVRFNGLLGTDALNSVNNRYSYLIDNQQNTLIFRQQ